MASHARQEITPLGGDAMDDTEVAGVVPSRILKESICTSETIDALMWDEEAFFYRLMTACDDHGRFDGRASVIRGKCFPLRLTWVLDDKIEAWLKRLEEVGLLELYTVGGKRYLQITTWKDHQQVRAIKSKYPQPQDDAGTCEQVISDEINGKQMSPYSYSYSKANYENREAVVEEEPQPTAEVDRLYAWFKSTGVEKLASPQLHAKWGRYLHEGLPREVIQLAVEEAAGAGIDRPNYITAILDRWKREGVTSIETAQAAIVKGKGERGKPTSGRSQFAGYDPDAILKG
jgi:DnaD/phage-associated family protein